MVLYFALVHLFIYESFCLSTSLSTSLSVCLLVYLPFFLSAWQSPCLSLICLSVCLSVCLSDWLTVCVCLILIIFFTWSWKTLKETCNFSFSVIPQNQMLMSLRYQPLNNSKMLNKVILPIEIDHFNSKFSKNI